MRRIVTACGFLPLAVRIADAHLATRPSWTPEQPARLLDTSRCPEHPRVGDTSLGAVLSLVHELCTWT